MLHKEYGKYIWDLKEQAIGEESKSHNDFLTACQVILYSSPPPLKSILAALYHLLPGQTPPLPPLVSPQRTSPWKNNQPLLFHPHQCPNNLLSLKVTPFARSHGEHAYRQCHSKGHFGRTTQPQEVRDPTLVHNTQTQPCQGIQPRLQYGKGGQKRILFQALLQLHVRWHLQPFQDV